jgi:hypothetical protein
MYLGPVTPRDARKTALTQPNATWDEDRSFASETLSRSRSLVDYTIDTHESEFSEATGRDEALVQLRCAGEFRKAKCQA